MKIYTKQGDLGETGLVGGQRVAKDHARIEAYGTIDELSAVLGIVGATPATPWMSPWIEQIQRDLFVIGAQLATPPPGESPTGVIQSADVQRIELWIDEAEAKLAPLTQFILPGGGRLAAHLHLARVVCRRAERRVVTLAGSAGLGGQSVATALLAYLNRVSDLMFVLARAANAAEGIQDLPWQGRRQS